MEQTSGEPKKLKDFLEEADLVQYFELFRDTLKVTKLSQLKFVASDDLVQIGMSKPEQRQYKKVYTKYFPNPYLSKIRRFLGTNYKRNEVTAQGCYEAVQPVEVQPFSENSVKVSTKHIIPVEDITINKELGMGQFGVVQQGTWTTGNQRIQVAIKCLGHERMTSNSTEFLKEAAVMHSIDHPNIVRLYGVVLHLDSLMLVTEIAPLRSLLECLREIPLRPQFPVITLCYFAEQICDGMTYLENKRLIHRDLAARNILVFNKDKVKISDFGLSRALGVGKDYYQTNYNVNLKLPVAWCAPECILYLRFTSASDVWAFGVCLWEMFTYGFQPWAAFSGQQILETIDAPNFQRLERPECCADAYYTTMLECWSHDPHNRPKFKDLTFKLREIRPQQMQVIANPEKADGRRINFLHYKVGNIITVLGKENMTKSNMWFGVLPEGACGMFDPEHTKLYTKHQRAASLSFHTSASLSPNPTRSTGRFSETLRSSILRSDTKRHTYTGKRTIQRSMISSPQGDVKHTGHIGLDGAYFGDISFLDPASCPPRQIVTPYKPSEDLEQPLINPNSPSYLTGGFSCTPPYPLLRQEVSNTNHVPGIDTDNNDGVNIQCGVTANSQTKVVSKKPNLNLGSDPTGSKKNVTKVKSSKIGKSLKTNRGSTASENGDDDIHEYHEISDTNTESTLADNIRSDNYDTAESPITPKSHTDFSQGLLDELDSMFRNLDGKGSRDDHIAMVKQQIEGSRSQTLNKTDRKKSFYTGTMKPMSAHEQKTLDTAVALANELTTRSMVDLDTKLPHSPNDRNKFHFKFPMVTSAAHHNQHSNEIDKEISGKQERRNFSDEANSVPDIQSTLTEESKLAYTSLIEQPNMSSSLIPQITKDSLALCKPPRTHPKPVPRPHQSHHSHLYPTVTLHPRYSIDETTYNASANTFKQQPEHDVPINIIPLPPRNTKPRLVDKPRHIRKHPLIMPTMDVGQNDNKVGMQTNYEEPPKYKGRTDLLYQNFFSFQNIHGIPRNVQRTSKKENGIYVQYQNLGSLGVDVLDAPSTRIVVDSELYAEEDSNPFNNPTASTRTINPFNSYPHESTVEDKEDEETSIENDNFDKGTLLKDCTDHVSVEDLLEFADQKPCGRQRGVESDEVRIMCKVLKQEVTPSDCLVALEISDWNVHHAIKIMRVKIAVGDGTNLEECSKEVIACNGDILKAASLVVKNMKKEI